MKNITTIALCVLMSSSFVRGEDLEIELTTSKDTFARSANRNGNSGANEYILLAPLPGSAIGLVAFDLASVTNQITSAEFSFRIHKSSAVPFSLTVAPMVYNENNPKWIEGTGNLGARGRNATLGEVTFQWRAFIDRPWEDASGTSVVNLMSSNLWKSPIKKFSEVKWDEGTWLSVKLDDPAMLEKIRTSELPTLTFGIWGTSGDGVYEVSTKESGHPAKLSLVVKENEEE